MSKSRLGIKIGDPIRTDNWGVCKVLDINDFGECLINFEGTKIWVKEKHIISARTKEDISAIMLNDIKEATEIITQQNDLISGLIHDLIKLEEGE